MVRSEINVIDGMNALASDIGRDGYLTKPRVVRRQVRAAVEIAGAIAIDPTERAKADKFITLHDGMDTDANRATRLVTVGQFVNTHEPKTRKAIIRRMGRVLSPR